MLNKLKEKDNSNLTKEDIYIFLQEYLDEQLAVSQREVTNEQAFEKPAWAEYTAYQLGMQKMCQRLKALIPDQGK